MWRRAQIKEEAKRILRNYYWMGFVVCLCYSIIMGVASGGSGSVSDVEYLIEDPTVRAGALMILGLISGVVGLVSLAITVFLKNVVEVGQYRFCMESRLAPSRFERLFHGFQCGSKNYGNIVFCLFLRDLWVFLWTLLLVVPGIIKGYQYRMVPYILAERPDMPYQRAFELSKQMTDGEKMEMFVLDLSFIGWWILGGLCCGIGVLFVNPYYQASWAELYTALREKAFTMGFSGPDELTGFQQNF